MVGGRPDPEVLRISELARDLTDGSTRESRSCTSPGNHSTADPINRGLGERAREHKYERSGPALDLPYGDIGKGEKAPILCTPLGLWKEESCP